MRKIVGNRVKALLCYNILQSSVCCFPEILVEIAMKKGKGDSGQECFLTSGDQGD